MPRDKAVKVRKWVTCVEPGCKRRAGTSRPYCGEHLKKIEEKSREGQANLAKARAVYRKEFLKTKKGRAAAKATAKKGKAQPKKPARKKSQKEITAAVKKRTWKQVPNKQKRAQAAAARKRGVGNFGSRLIKAHCEKCGYTIRLSRKWIEVKRPICPVCEKNMVTELDHANPDPHQLSLKKARKGKGV